MVDEQRELFPDLPAHSPFAKKGVPEDTGDFELLVDIIGYAAAWKVAKSFAGSSIYIPKNILTKQSHKDIRKKYKDGTSYRELSAEYGYTERHIRRITNRSATK